MNDSDIETGVDQSTQPHQIAFDIVKDALTITQRTNTDSNEVPDETKAPQEPEIADQHTPRSESSATLDSDPETNKTSSKKEKSEPPFCGRHIGVQTRESDFGGYYCPSCVYGEQQKQHRPQKKTKLPFE